MSNLTIIGAIFGPGEIVLILFVGMALFVSQRFGDLRRGLKQGILEFRKATKEIFGGLDQEAFDAGRSIGGIHGQPAAQAITVENEVAELYKPAAFEKGKRGKTLNLHFRTACKKLFLFAKRFLSRPLFGRNRKIH